ncbi:SNF1-related protein kinase catalytic subunit alpha KIN11-like [Strongylocentrotus purpuratus]|uniref:Protein kinase domain-containing protein n=1 Tax=Strongylocentrotus purpuratus TaxID=7668 RepID=A0A7M7SYA1_STRPU|nr:SNF1-related protein kinase catalytic subunit alpha KIN11-like [Strongylocentrotus purpuratus]
MTKGKKKIEKNMEPRKDDQVLYTDEVPSLTKKGNLYLPNKKGSPLDTLGLDLLMGNVMNRGQYCKVIHVYSKKRNCDFALKIFCKLSAPDIVKKKFFPQEILIMKKLSHDHVLGLVEVLLTNRNGYLLMDFMPNGSLRSYINKQDHGHLSEPEARFLFHQLQSAIAYLHSMDIVHRDVKCSVLLLDKDYRLKLSEFQFATNCADGEKLTEACGSMGYVAPEILEGDPYEGKPVDLWSMGVTLFAMLCGRLPYHEDCLDILLDSIYNPQEKLCFPNSVSKDCRAFVHALLVPQPQKRAKFSDLAKMEWLVHPTITAHSLLTSAPTMTSQYKSGGADDGCVPASSGASLDAMLQSCSKKGKQSVSFDTNVEHGFSESQKEAGKKEDGNAVVTDVLKAVAIRHATGESPMSVHKNLDTPIGHGPHHFAPDTIGLKGPAARRISAQLSQTNVNLNQSHQHHHNAHPTSALKASVTRVGHHGGGHHGLGPRKANWQAEGGAANVAVSRKNSLLMQTANSCGVSNLGRGSIALHCGKIQPGGSTINLSSVDLSSYNARCQEKDREHELHDLQYSTGSKIAHLAGAKHHRAAETTRINSIFTEDMKAQQEPNALKPEEQEMLDSFRSQCDTMKHLVA